MVDWCLSFFQSGYRVEEGSEEKVKRKWTGLLDLQIQNRYHQGNSEPWAPTVGP